MLTTRLISKRKQRQLDVDIKVWEIYKNENPDYPHQLRKRVKQLYGYRIDTIKKSIIRLFENGSITWRN